MRDSLGLTSRRRIKPSAVIPYMTAARMTEGVAPATGTNSRMSRQREINTPFSAEQHEAERCEVANVQSGDRDKMAEPAVRKDSVSSSDMPVRSPSSRPRSNPASRSGSAAETAFLQKRAMRCGRYRGLPDAEPRRSKPITSPLLFLVENAAIKQPSAARERSRSGLLR